MKLEPGLPVQAKVVFIQWGSRAMDAQGTCIVRQAIIEAAIFNPRILETAGFRVKQVAASSAADMIMSRAGITAGFLVFSAVTLVEQPLKTIEAR